VNELSTDVKLQLVYIENGRTVTDSLTVAEVFGKSHDKVLRDIRELECSNEFSLSNFGESNYTNDRGREYMKYIITQDGFAFLAMGYTGKLAATFKEKYIKAFNEMRTKLESSISYKIEDPIRRAEAWIVEQKEKQQLLLQIEENKPLVLFAETALKSNDVSDSIRL